MLEILRNVDYNPHFFHIHTFNSEEEKWSEGQIISTQNRGKRTFINYPKKFREEEFEKIRQGHLKTFLLDIHVYFYLKIWILQNSG